MPHYKITITNQSDTTSRAPLTIGRSQIEYADAPDEATVLQMIHRDISRTTDPALYTWLIETVDPAL